MPHILSVVGLGFGDEGKGSITDHLTRLHDAKLVVRYNGGAQAAHNVVTDDGRQHTFAQFGSGTLAGATTHLSRFMLVNPFTFFTEAEKLALLMGKTPAEVCRTVTVHKQCLVTTPFHIQANRHIEEHRSAKHGSCGMGIGETVALTAQDLYLPVDDLTNTARVKGALTSIRDHYLRRYPGIEARPWFNDPTAIDNCIERYRLFYEAVLVTSTDYVIEHPGPIIFEGAQGVLLDQDFGFHPHTTWSRTTLQNVEYIVGYRNYDNVRRIGVMRAITTRHGAGPLPTEEKRWKLTPKQGERNDWNAWQESFRVGYLDLPLMAYALSICDVDEIALTCVDQLFTTAAFPGWEPRVCVGYRDNGEYVPCGSLRPPLSLAEQEQRGQWLNTVKPVLERVYNVQHLVHTIERYLQVPVTIVSNGPTAKDKTTWFSNPVEDV